MDVKELILRDNIEHLFQPMWNIGNGSIFGYEALFRISSKSVKNIELIFMKAREQGLLYELDTCSIQKAVQSFPVHLIESELLFVNIFPSTLIHDDFENFIKTLLIRFPEIKKKMVFELNETIQEEPLWDIPLFKKRIEMLKTCDFLVALDDVGKGMSTVKQMIELNPDYIKLDRYFSDNLASSKEKQRMVSLMKEYCQNGTGLVLEGIEKEKDLATAKLLNVPIAQGYLIGKPQKIRDVSMLDKFNKNFPNCPLPI